MENTPTTEFEWPDGLYAWEVDGSYEQPPQPKPRGSGVLEQAIREGRVEVE